MKKQFQILNIAITIVLVSCGKHNAEISGATINGVKELSTNTSVASNEADLLSIDMKGQLRFNTGSGEIRDKIAGRLKKDRPGTSSQRIYDSINKISRSQT